jgi:hypothetical protein
MGKFVTTCPAGIALDPFVGTGTTILAAYLDQTRLRIEASLATQRVEQGGLWEAECASAILEEDVLGRLQGKLPQAVRLRQKCERNG